MALLFVLQAIPIPFSIFSWIGTLMVLAGDSVDWTNIFAIVLHFLGAGFFIFIGLYPITYLIALGKTLSEKKLCKWSYLPAWHILVVILVVVIVSVLGTILEVLGKIAAFL